jgi:hypothetical protein
MRVGDMRLRSGARSARFATRSTYTSFTANTSVTSYLGEGGGGHGTKHGGWAVVEPRGTASATAPQHAPRPASNDRAASHPIEVPVVRSIGRHLGGFPHSAPRFGAGEQHRWPLAKEGS